MEKTKININGFVAEKFSLIGPTALLADGVVLNIRPNWHSNYLKKPCYTYKGFHAFGIHLNRDVRIF